MELDNVIRRIQKCLALGKSSNEHEAAAAMRQAQKLMEAYNILPEHVGMLVIELHPAKSTACTKPPRWEQWLATTIGRCFGCKVLHQRGWFDSVNNRNGDLGKYIFIGPKAQAMTAAWTMDMLRNRVVAGRLGYLKDKAYPKLAAKMAAGNTYCEGFVSALSRKVEDFAGNDEATTKAIEDQVSQHSSGGSPKTTQRQKGSWADYDAGRAQGEKTAIHRPISG